MISLNEAIQLASERFPFRDYMTPHMSLKNHSSYYNISNTILLHLKAESRILDFGCGPCDKLAILNLLGFECSGYDDLKDEWHRKAGNLEKILSFAATSGIDLKLADQGLDQFEKESFDLVMSHDVLENLHDSPRELLNDLLELVKPGGLLFVTVPSAVNIRKRISVLRGQTNLPNYASYYWYPGPWRGHVREYVKSDMVKLAEYLDLEVVELRACDHMLRNVPAILRTPYLWVTALLPGWKDSWLLVARKRPGWVARKAASPERLAQLLGNNAAYMYGE
jgi:SAM-dependent methyltransferase